MFLYLCPHDRSRDKVVGALHDICLNLQPNLERLKPSKLLLYKLPPLLLPHTHLSKHEPGREHVWIKTVGRCPSVSTPTVSPSIPLKKPPTQRGDVRWPPPRRLGSKGWDVYTLLCTVNTVGCELGLYQLQTKEKRLRPTSWGVYCAWLQRTGAWVHRDPPVSLYWASPDCMNEQTDRRPRSFELYTVWF